MNRDDSDPLASLLSWRRESPQQRRDRIVAEVQANRRGEYRIPTWALALALVAMIGAVVVLLTL
jgi:hypothetical protein